MTTKCNIWSWNGSLFGQKSLKGHWDSWQKWNITTTDWNITTTDYTFIVTMLNFLSLITLLQLFKRISLFLGNIYWYIKGHDYVAFFKRVKKKINWVNCI